jgi:hypothetical protein
MTRLSTSALAPLLLVCGLAGCADSMRPQPVEPTPIVQVPSAPVLPTPPPPPESARYLVSFESTWSASTHPTDFPDDAHYSRLIGGTHDSRVEFWREGGLASDGIQRMAERGRTTPLDEEVNAAVATGPAQHLLLGPALERSPGSVSFEFDITRTFPLVTLVTMVAPSPDWFVGVSGVPLFADGQWRDLVAVDLVVFDAGTDNGGTFRSADEVTRPQQLISRLTGYPVATGGITSPFGRFLFTRR